MKTGAVVQQKQQTAKRRAAEVAAKRAADLEYVRGLQARLRAEFYAREAKR